MYVMHVCPQCMSFMYVIGIRPPFMSCMYVLNVCHCICPCMFAATPAKGTNKSTGTPSRTTAAAAVATASVSATERTEQSDVAEVTAVPVPNAVSVCAFNAMEIETLAQERKVDKLQELAAKAIALVKATLVPLKGWRSALPTWVGKGKAAAKKKGWRGLKSWVKDPDLCHSWVQKAVDFYAETIGVPPVITGVKKRKRKRKHSAKGHTRGQVALSHDTTNSIDYQGTFLLILAAHYCLHAKPTVDDGTDAAHAVIAVMMEPKTKKALLSTVCRVCMSFKYVLDVCHACVSLVYAVNVCHACVSLVYVLNVCHACMSSMYVVHICHACYR